MSWEHIHYRAICKKCGQEGEKISSSDDWNNSEISWVGFAPYRDFARWEYLVVRKRIDPNEYAVCPCGSTDIEIGEIIGRS
jgi:hypothetical protein